MKLEELKKEIAVWNLWCYDFLNKEIHCYGLQVILEDDTKFYKLKTLIKDVQLHTFWQLLLDKACITNYTSQQHSNIFCV